jgi:hypothetical protein
VHGLIIRSSAATLVGARIYGSILETKPGKSRSSAELFAEAIRRMPSDPLPDVPVAEEAEVKPSDAPKRPAELSEFSQRLASFGLGEAPDPLLTEARPPSKRRSRT